MKNFLLQKPLLTLSGALLVVAFLIFLILSFFSSGHTQPAPVSPSPTSFPQQLPVYAIPSGQPPLPGQGTEYQQSEEEIHKKEQEKIHRDSLVGELIPLLPYTGQNFTLRYDFSNNTFVATLNKQNLLQANRDLDTFLQSNGIQQRSWIENLVIQ